jgi:hypothetical protein
MIPSRLPRAQACLETILEEFRHAAEVDQTPEHTLQHAVEGWLTERNRESGLKRSTIAGYEDMFERLFRARGADTPVRSLAGLLTKPGARPARRAQEKSRSRSEMSATAKSRDDDAMQNFVTQLANDRR